MLLFILEEEDIKRRQNWKTLWDGPCKKGSKTMEVTIIKG